MMYFKLIKSLLALSVLVLASACGGGVVAHPVALTTTSQHRPQMLAVPRLRVSSSWVMWWPTSWIVPAP